MSAEASIEIQDNATPAIAEKVSKCSPRRLGAIIGRPMAEFWRDRLAKLGTNKRGWPSTRFYERAARSVTNVPQPDGVRLEANQQGLRQRWKGGPIPQTGGSGKMLTIPISPVSYGKTAADFPGLFLLKTKKGAYLVQRGEDVSKKTGKLAGIGRKGGGNSSRRLRASLNFLFKLVKSVNQVGDPRVVPTNDEFLEVAFTKITEAVQ